MRIKVLIISAVLALVAWLSSCDKLETYSEIPSVEFLKVYISDTLDALGNVVLRQDLYLQVIDGDGNLGLNDSDTSDHFSQDSVYYNDLFVSISKKTGDSTYTEIQPVSDNLKYRIPYNEPIGQNKYLKAEVKVKLEPASAVFDGIDTVRYEVFVYDRDLNRSETAYSCDIPIHIHGTVYANGTMELVSEAD